MPDPPLRLAFVIPWRDPGAWLFDHVRPDAGALGELVFAAPEWHSLLWRRPLPPYLQELVCLARRRTDWRRFEVVFTWELRSFVAASLLIGCLPRHARPTVIAVGPILKGEALRMLPLLRRLFARAARIVCFARAECDAYAGLLGLPRDRFVFLPTPWRVEIAAEDDDSLSPGDDGYALALGQSNRDYATLLRAAARCPHVPLTLVAGNPSAFGGETVPPHVVTHFNTGHHETNRLIARASFHVIPLHEAGFSAGQTVLLRAMASGKACIVSDTPGVCDYVRDGQTALLVPPGDVAALQATMERLWSDPALRRRLGENAARAVAQEFAFGPFVENLVCLAREARP